MRILVLLSCAVFAFAQINIAIVTQVNKKDDAIKSIFVKEIDRVLKLDFKSRYNYYDISSFKEAFAKNDLVVALGVASSNILAEQKSYSKPAIASILFKRVKSKKNFYPIYMLNVKKDFEKLIDGKSSTFIVDSIHSKIDSDSIVFSKDLDFKNKKIESAILAPMFNLSDLELKELIEKLNRASIPSFSLVGRKDVEFGALASIYSEANFDKLARLIAINSLSILLKNGAKVEQHFNPSKELLINMQTAKKIAFPLNWNLLAKAKFLQKDEKAISLEKVIDLAFEQNLNLQVESYLTKLQKRKIGLAKSNLYPALELDLNHLSIDSKSAKNSFGSYAQRELNAKASIKIPIYIEKIFANIEIQNTLLQNEEILFQEAKKELALQISQIYLNILKTKSILEIERENLALSNKNLELAKVRNEIGYSSRADLYRWRSEIARAKQEVIEATQSLKILQNSLKQLLESKEEFDIENISLDNGSLISSNREFLEFLNRIDRFDSFIEFMKSVAIRESLTLKSFETLMLAKRREILSLNRAIYLPEVAFEFSDTYILDRAGEGSDVNYEKNRFNAGVNFSLDLNFGKVEDIESAKLELLKLLKQKDSIESSLENQIATAIDSSAISYSSIKFSKEALDDSKKTFELFSDSYAKGQADITDLIDSQKNMLSNEIALIDATYSFIYDLKYIEFLTNTILIDKDRAFWHKFWIDFKTYRDRKADR